MEVCLKIEERTHRQQQKNQRLDKKKQIHEKIIQAESQHLEKWLRIVEITEVKRLTLIFYIRSWLTDLSRWH